MCDRLESIILQIIYASDNSYITQHYSEHYEYAFYTLHCGIVDLTCKSQVLFVSLCCSKLDFLL